MDARKALSPDKLMLFVDTTNRCASWRATDMGQAAGRVTFRQKTQRAEPQPELNWVNSF